MIAAMIFSSPPQFGQCAMSERLLASVLQVFRSAQAHHGYLLVNARTIEELLPHSWQPGA
jgi:hypothetical protein